MLWVISESEPHACIPCGLPEPSIRMRFLLTQLSFALCNAPASLFLLLEQLRMCPLSAPGERKDLPQTQISQKFVSNSIVDRDVEGTWSLRSQCPHFILLIHNSESLALNRLRIRRLRQDGWLKWLIWDGNAHYRNKQGTIVYFVIGQSSVSSLQY
jgi:hypothetical protein